MIGQRKEGDAGDAYAECSARVHGGEWDTLFAEMGVDKPTR